MQIEINKTKFRLYLGTLLFLLSGHFYLIFGQMIERFLLLLSVPFFYKEFKVIFRMKNSQWYENVHFLFILCFIVDIIMYFTITPIIYMFGMLYIWIIVFRIFPFIGGVKMYGIAFYEWMYKLNFIISFVTIGIGFLFEPIRFVNYSGIFANPNTFGNYAAFATVFLFPIFLDYLRYKNINRITLYISIVIFFLLCLSVIISSSRTAFLTIVFEILFFVGYVLKISWDMKNKRLFKKIVFGSLTILLFGSFLILFTDLVQIINTAIFNKFHHLSNNQLNGRNEYWEYIWVNSRIFENGFKDIGASHNVYLGLIDQFGKLAGIIYLIYILLNFLKLFKLSMRKKSVFWNHCSVFAGIVFLSVSMTENYLLTISMLWFYCMIPIQECLENRKNLTC